jgi:hypothetical protein
LRPYLEKNPSQKRAGVVVQGVGPEFKPHYHKNKRNLSLTKFLDHRVEVIKAYDFMSYF